MEKPWIIHEYAEQDTNGDFLVSKPRLKTTPMFSLEKQAHLKRKQIHFILTLPVAGAVEQWHSDRTTGKVGTQCHIFIHKHFCQNSSIEQWL